MAENLIDLLIVCFIFINFLGWSLFKFLIFFLGFLDPLLIFFCLDRLL